MKRVSWTREATAQCDQFNTKPTVITLIMTADISPLVETNEVLWTFLKICCFRTSALLQRWGQNITQVHQILQVRHQLAFYTSHTLQSQLIIHSASTHRVVKQQSAPHSIFLRTSDWMQMPKWLPEHSRTSYWACAACSLYGVTVGQQPRKEEQLGSGMLSCLTVFTWMRSQPHTGYADWGRLVQSGGCVGF